MPSHEAKAWEPIAVAAERLGMDAGTLRRQCQRAQFLGMAEKRRNGRHKAGWFVCLGYKPEMIYSGAMTGVLAASQAEAAAARRAARQPAAPATAVPFRAVSLDGLPPHSAATVALRLLILYWWEQELERAKATGQSLDKATEVFIVKLRKRQRIEVCRATLHNWRRTLVCSGPNALADLRETKRQDPSDKQSSGVITLKLEVHSSGQAVIIDGVSRRGSKAR